MTRLSRCFTVLVCALATPALADGARYRCSAIDLLAWQGLPDPSNNALDVAPGRIAFTLDAATGLYQALDNGDPVGPRVQLTMREWAGEATRGMPQIVAEHPDGDFSLRIALDNEPIRFALLYPVSVVTGTCLDATESARK